MVNEVEHVLSVQNKLGEGPLWHAQEQALYWVDIESDCFYRWSPETGKLDRFEVGLPVGVLGFRQAGGIVLATRDGFAFWSEADRSLQMIADPEADKPEARFNDGAVDPQGRFLAGTMGQGYTGALYRLDPDGSVHTLETAIGISNGIGWSPDNATMYYTDSLASVIYAYDYDVATGALSNRRDLIRVPEEDGLPDGLTVDSEGYIWSARWGGSKITRHASDGSVDRDIQLPVSQITSCTFGGPNLDELYITTAWTGLTLEQREAQPMAGDLFRLKTDVRGQDEPRFAG